MKQQPYQIMTSDNNRMLVQAMPHKQIMHVIANDTAVRAHLQSNGVVLVDLALCGNTDHKRMVCMQMVGKHLCANYADDVTPSEYNTFNTAYQNYVFA